MGKGVEYNADTVSFTEESYSVDGLDKINEALAKCESDEDSAHVELTARELRLIRRLLVLDTMHETLLLADRMDRVDRIKSGGR